MAETAKELAKIIIEELKELLRCRADALNLKSTHKRVEEILREETTEFVPEEIPKGGIQPFNERG